VLPDKIRRKSGEHAACNNTDIFCWRKAGLNEILCVVNLERKSAYTLKKFENDFLNVKEGLKPNGEVDNYGPNRWALMALGASHKYEILNIHDPFIQSLARKLHTAERNA
jgi:hypothetical protein